MEIRKVSSHKIDQVSSVEKSPAAPSSRKSPAKEDAPLGGVDSLSLSGKYQEMRKIRKVAMELSDIRSERVDKIRRKIEDGSYVVDPDGISEKMLEEFL